VKRGPRTARAPLLITMLTRAPFASRRPAFGLWWMTRPFAARREAELRTEPTRQWWLRIDALACASVLPVTDGTTHLGGVRRPGGGGGEAGGGGLAGGGEAGGGEAGGGGGVTAGGPVIVGEVVNAWNSDARTDV